MNRARVRFRFLSDRSPFHLIGPALGIARPGVLDGIDGHGGECWATPLELRALDPEAAEFLIAAIEAYRGQS